VKMIVGNEKKSIIQSSEMFKRSLWF